jgi:hypothetical protein
VSPFCVERFAGAAMRVSDVFFFHEAAEREELACYDGTVVGGTYARLHYMGDFAFWRRCWGSQSENIL